MRKGIIILFIALLVIGIIYFNLSEDEVTFTHSDLGFTMNLPPEWKDNYVTVYNEYDLSRSVTFYYDLGMNENQAFFDVAVIRNEDVDTFISEAPYMEDYLAKSNDTHTYFIIMPMDNILDQEQNEKYSALSISFEEAKEALILDTYSKE